METLRLCRPLDNGALEQRRTWWGRGWGRGQGRGQGRAATHAQQAAELPDRNAAFPDYAAAMHSHVLQDVLTRLDRA